MNRTLTVFLAIVGVAILAVALMVGLVLSPQSGPLPQIAAKDSDFGTVKKSGTTVVTVASSLTKQKWMEAVVANFHAADIRTGKGSRIAVEVKGVLSGGSMWKILDGRMKPVVWSPGAVSWVEQFRERWAQAGNGSAITAQCRPSIYSPIGLAMWRPMAEALGWPDKPIGWQTIVDLAADPAGWSRYEHPEWGRLKLGHPHPNYSNAGMLYLTSFVYGMTQKTDSLTAAEVYDQKVETAMRVLAQNTAKYGMISTDLLRLMAQHGPDFLHAVSAFEEGTVRLNLERGNELRFPMVFIFPSEGTFWSSHPYCIMDGTDWVDDEQAEAAGLFFDYLQQREQQALAVSNLLRPLDGTIPIQSPLDLANGADPRIGVDTVPPLAVPSSEVSSAIIDLFMITKRKATIQVVLDLSGSMAGAKIRSATEATAAFLKRLHPDDIVGVTVFSDDIVSLSPPQRVADVVETLAERVTNLVTGGGTSLHGAVCDVMSEMNRLRAEDESTNSVRLYGVVLLSDGRNTNGSPSANQMFTNCLPSHAEAEGVKVFPIAFGDEADVTLLKRIAAVTGGRMYAADTDSIEKAYLRISAEQ
jgi:Ca-activated chloride channel family protein